MHHAMHHAMHHPYTDQCTAQLAYQPKTQIRPQPTYTERDYMILLLNKAQVYYLRLDENDIYLITTSFQN